MFITPQNAQTLADELRSVLHREVNVMGPEGQIIASTDHSRIGQLHPGALRIVQEKLSELLLYPGTETGEMRPGINLPIRLGGEIVGVIGITGDPEELMIPGEVIRKMTELMVTDLQHQQQAAERSHARRVLFEALLFSDSPDLREAEARAARLGMDLSCPRSVAVLIGQNAPEELSEIASRLRRLSPDPEELFCFESRGKLLLILPAKDGDAAATQLLGLMGSLPEPLRSCLYCGVSEPAEDPSDLRRRYRHAVSALETARRSGDHRPVLYSEASLHFLLSSIPLSRRQELRQVLFSACTEEQRQICRDTVLLFFLHHGNIDRAAESIFVHRNTLYHRIRQVQQFTGRSLFLPEDAFLLYIACMEDN